MALRHYGQADLVLLHRPDQSNAPLDLTIVEHDDKTLSAECFQSDSVGARCDGALDASAQELLEGEEDILQVDGKRQQPVPESRDRRQAELAKE
jgi:hypothetical protein